MNEGRHDRAVHLGAQQIVIPHARRAQVVKVTIGPHEPLEVAPPRQRIDSLTGPAQRQAEPPILLWDDRTDLLDGVLPVVEPGADLVPRLPLGQLLEAPIQSVGFGGRKPGNGQRLERAHERTTALLPPSRLRPGLLTVVV